MPSVQASRQALYREFAGEREPWLTLVHGGLVDSVTWERQVAALSGVACVLTYDLRGYGRSPTPTTTPTIEDHACDLIELWDAVGVSRGFVAGFSLGGLIAQEVTLSAPGRVEGLMLASTAARLPIDVRRGYLERAAVVEAGGIEAELEAHLERAFSRRFHEQQPELIARYRSRVAATSREAIASSLRAVASFDRLDDLPAIRCPTLVIAGAEDHGMPVAGAARLVERMPSARLAVLRGVGHTVHVEAPSSFNHLVGDFLAFDGLPPEPGH